MLFPACMSVCNGPRRRGAMVARSVWQSGVESKACAVMLAVMMARFMSSPLWSMTLAFCKDICKALSAIGEGVKMHVARSVAFSKPSCRKGATRSAIGSARPNGSSNACMASMTKLTPAVPAASSTRAPNSKPCSWNHLKISMLPSSAAMRTASAACLRRFKPALTRNCRRASCPLETARQILHVSPKKSRTQQSVSTDPLAASLCTLSKMPSLTSSVFAIIQCRELLVSRVLLPDPSLVPNRRGVLLLVLDRFPCATLRTLASMLSSHSCTSV
mmetsp:Transcript_54046/g.150295  ORF Transcript_54046/g.150295 Transcript_54046/m.150295 type:complete len:274 (+) Transcript_54046:815-1636(+)